MITLGLWVLGKNIKDNVFLITYIKGHVISTRLITIDVNTNHLLKVAFARFLYYDITILFSRHTLFFGCESLSPVHTQGGWNWGHLAGSVMPPLEHKTLDLVLSSSPTDYLKKKKKILSLSPIVYSPKKKCVCIKSAVNLYHQTTCEYKYPRCQLWKHLLSCSYSQESLHPVPRFLLLKNILQKSQYI